MRIVRFLFLPLWTVSLASAQSGIEHDALTCMSTNEFPIIEAEIDAAELRAVRKAQVYFKANATDTWYFVEMEPGEGTVLRGMLPRPLAETKRVDYYVFALSGTFEPWQTQEYSVYVTESGCGGPRAVASGTPASLTLHATVVNQPPIPPGFQPGGITGLVTTTGNTVAVGAAAGGGAASGGVSAATVGILGGAGAAAAVGAVVVTGNDEGNSTDAGLSSPDEESSTGDVTSTSPSPEPTPTPTPAPSPAPTPMPMPLDISGRWILEDRLVDSCEPTLLGRTSQTAMTIQQNGSSLTASRVNPNGSFREDLSGTIDAAGYLTMKGPFTDESDTGQSRWDARATSSEEMSGTYTRFYPAYNCTLGWTFDGRKN